MLIYAAGILVAADRVLLDVPIGNLSKLLTAIAMMVLGVQATGLGLLAEIVTFVPGLQRKEFTLNKIT